MKNKKYIPLLIVISLVAIFYSCEALGDVAAVGAKIGQAAGVISEDTANIFTNEKTREALNKTGVAWKNAFEEIDSHQEYYIGRAVAANILASYKLQANRQAMVTYLNRICNALVVNSPRPEIFNGYHVNILDTDEINAFATPGGHILVTRGLLASTTSEDELAAVIAHEVAHIQLQHALKAIKNNRITQALIITGVSGAGVAGDATGNMNITELTAVFDESISEIITTMVTNGYSRDQEYDADSTALALLELAGYEPSSLISMLRVLEKNQAGKTGGFGKTHPTPAQRIANAEKKVGDFRVDPDTRSFRVSRYKAST